MEVGTWKQAGSLSGTARSFAVVVASLSDDMEMYFMDSKSTCSLEENSKQVDKSLFYFQYYFLVQLQLLFR